ncbi:hypothetical protein [Nocardia gipuzkoensis]|uniref:hypothetical protein n=1 Tax=Nocardia gipuzkoensis TaxID=2749991 RepID=UPI00237DEEC4|nr:hypothetical protein [Nocardia gipuzkoensis]MDE1673745.1 hypothetical protein [Nocardia gipuzkoensis]
MSDHLFDVAAVTALHGPPRWQEDDALIEAAMNGRVNHSHLQPTDRAWLIAQLTHRNHTTETIAAWLHCSRRTVQMVRREAVAVLTLRLLAAEQVAKRASARADAARVTPAAMAQILAERDRFRDQRGQLIDQLAEMRRRCDEPCPPEIVIVKPFQPRRRRTRTCAPTLALFEVAG